MIAVTTRSVDLSAHPAEAPEEPPADALELVYPGHAAPQALVSDGAQAAVVQPLMTAFATVQQHWAAITAAQSGGRVVVLAPASAALGDPDRPLDAAVVGGLISFVRSVAIELQRHGGTANIVFFDRLPDEPAVQAMVATLLADTTSSVTGQEIYLAGGSSLGRLHP